MTLIALPPGRRVTRGCASFGGTPPLCRTTSILFLFPWAKGLTVNTRRVLTEKRVGALKRCFCLAGGSRGQWGRRPTLSSSSLPSGWRASSWWPPSLPFCHCWLCCCLRCCSRRRSRHRLRRRSCRRLRCRLHRRSHCHFHPRRDGGGGA